MKDYFSYDSEIIVYESTMGIAPVSSHRTVSNRITLKGSELD